MFSFICWLGLIKRASLLITKLRWPGTQGYLTRKVIAQLILVGQPEELASASSCKLGCEPSEIRIVSYVKISRKKVQNLERENVCITILKLPKKKENPFWSYSAEIIVADYHCSRLYLTYDWFGMEYVGHMWNIHLVLLNSQKSNETTSTHQTMHAKDTS